jgi:hypothetical protein
MWLMIAAAPWVSVVACSGDSGGDSSGAARPGTATTAAESPTQESPTSAPVFGKPTLIETRIIDAARHVGVVLGTSVVGESAFCRGGRTSGGSEGAAITTTFHCPGGTLMVRYAPTQRSLVQGAAWEVVSGTGSWAGLHGGGSMVAVFEKDDPDRGREIFTGTIGE